MRQALVSSREADILIAPDSFQRRLGRDRVVRLMDEGQADYFDLLRCDNDNLPEHLGRRQDGASTISIVT
jgi:hypothetical protein